MTTPEDPKYPESLPDAPNESQAATLLGADGLVLSRGKVILFYDAKEKSTSASFSPNTNEENQVLVLRNAESLSLDKGAKFRISDHRFLGKETDPAAHLFEVPA